MLGDPVVYAECDNCGEEEGFGLTSLARNSWDMRNFPACLRSRGWIVAGDDEHYCCEQCAEEAAHE